MSKTPSQRAEACFAVARSTAHEGERDAAISRGKFICDRHSLDLDDFDIPGRKRTRPTGGMRGGSFDIQFDLNGNGFARRESAYSSTQGDIFGFASVSDVDLERFFDAMSRGASYRAQLFCLACGHSLPVPVPVKCPNCGV
jgi:hypothetical protein